MTNCPLTPFDLIADLVAALEEGAMLNVRPRMPFHFLPTGPFQGQR